MSFAELLGQNKAITLLTRAVYAEVSRARVAESAAEFRKLALHTSMVAAAAGALVVGVALLAGEQLLSLLAGPDFAKGAVILAGGFDIDDELYVAESNE